MPRSNRRSRNTISPGRIAFARGVYTCPFVDSRNRALWRREWALECDATIAAVRQAYSADADPPEVGILNKYRLRFLSGTRNWKADTTP